MEHFEKLREVVDEMAHKTSVWSRDNKKKAFSLSLLIAIFSALVTILVGVQSDFPFWVEHEESVNFFFKVTILTFSGTSTVLAAWDNFYNHKQLWINYGDTRNMLKALLLEMDMCTDDEKQDLKVVKEYMNKYNHIMAEGNSKWKELRLNEDDSNSEQVS